MEKKSKTNEISAAKWKSEHGTAWKCIIYLLNLQDLANLRSCSSTLNLIGKVERVPWKELSAVMNANVRRLVWADQPNDLGRRIYRWFVLHFPSHDMRRGLLALYADVVITTQLQYAATKALIARLCPLQKYHMFCYDADEYAMAVFTNADGRSKKLTCDNCEPSGKACCHPDQHGMSFSTLQVYSNATHSCGGKDGCAEWRFLDDVRIRTLRGPETILDDRTGLRKASHRFRHITRGPDDGYPHCECLWSYSLAPPSSYTDEAMDLAELGEELNERQSRPFDPKKLLINDFTHALK